MSSEIIAAIIGAVIGGCLAAGAGLIVSDHILLFKSADYSALHNKK